MRHVFVLNGRKDKASILSKVESAIAGLDIKLDYSIYSTEGAGDATRYVNLYCDLAPEEQTCFVACGGSGIANEVASAIVGRPHKALAVFHCDGTNDFVKSFPGRDFTDLGRILTGNPLRIDVMKINDSFSINVANVGMDAHAAVQANENILEGKNNPYVRSVLGALFMHRFHKMDISIDGERINRRLIQQMIIANGQYYGGSYHPCPMAVSDDGLMDVLILKPMNLLSCIYFEKKMRTGAHVNDKYCRKRIVFKRAKHIVMSSDELIYICYDGEIMASSRLEIELLEKALPVLIPRNV